MKTSAHTARSRSSKQFMNSTASATSSYSTQPFFASGKTSQRGDSSGLSPSAQEGEDVGGRTVGEFVGDVGRPVGSFFGNVFGGIVGAVAGNDIS